MVGRLTVIVVVLGLSAVAAMAVSYDDATLVAVPAVGALAFASNLARRLHPIVRMMALAVQAVALLVTTFVLLGSFSWAQGPWPERLVLTAAIVAECLAIGEGRRALSKG